MALLEKSPSPIPWWQRSIHPWEDSRGGGGGEEAQVSPQTVLTSPNPTIDPSQLLVTTDPYTHIHTPTVAIPHAPVHSIAAVHPSSRFSPPPPFDDFSQSRNFPSTGTRHPLHKSLTDPTDPRSDSTPVSPALTLLPQNLLLHQPIPQRPSSNPQLEFTLHSSQSFLPRERTSSLPPQNPVLRSFPTPPSTAASPDWRKRSKESLNVGNSPRYSVEHPYPKLAKDQQTWHREHIADWRARMEAHKSRSDEYRTKKEKKEYRSKVQKERSGYNRARKAYDRFLTEHARMSGMR